jgi:3-methyl-2-oxobutanoate hydroxymethyltransferase
MKDKITVPEIVGMKARSEKIACLTAYDYTTATLLDQAGLDLILVGDSAGMVMAGHKTTIPVTLDQMVYHTQCVSRGVKRALLITDLPFGAFQVSPEDTMRNAIRLMQKGGAEGVKLEGGAHMVETIRKLTDCGIPVMGHLGLTPQHIKSFGGYRVRGKSDKEADELKKSAKLLEEAGAFSMVLEKIPADLAKEITASVNIPTIGIGAGPHCDGQILVTQDVLGLYEDFKPRFVRRYAELSRTIREAVGGYSKDVRSGNYPSKEESF